jgi:hypothetical protein
LKTARRSLRLGPAEVFGPVFVHVEQLFHLLAVAVDGVGEELRVLLLLRRLLLVGFDQLEEVRALLVEVGTGDVAQEFAARRLVRNLELMPDLALFEFFEQLVPTETRLVVVHLVLPILRKTGDNIHLLLPVGLEHLVKLILDLAVERGNPRLFLA